MRSHRIVLLLSILLGLSLACSALSGLSKTPAVRSTQPASQAQPGTPGSSSAQSTAAAEASPVPGQPQTGQGTIDGLVAGTLALHSVKITLTTTQPDGQVTSLTVEIDAAGNQHLLKTYPTSSTPLFSNGADNPPTKIELYVLAGVAYAPDDKGVLRPAESQDMAFALKAALLSPDGPAFWLKVLPAGSLSSQGSESSGGFQARKYLIQGTLEDSAITGLLWVEPDRQALLGAEMDLPGKLYGPQKDGTLKISFHVEQADVPAIQPKTAAALPTKTPASSQPTQATAAGPTLADSFPLAPGASLDQSSRSEPEAGDPKGNFDLVSTEMDVTKVAAYYAAELPKENWTLRYAENNYSGGLAQYWKQEHTYLKLDYVYQDNGLVVKASYERVDPAAAQKLPKDFPVPANAELISASDTSWTFYIPQEQAKVAETLDTKIKALGWTSAPGMTGGGEGEGDNGGKSYPPGANPQPAPTLDPRPIQERTYVTPDGNEVSLSIRPHRKDTLLVIDLTIKQASAAGLPSDVPIYPGGQIQMASPGMLMFQTTASVQTVKQFYLDKLKANGLTADGEPIESGDTALLRWTKDSYAIQITLAPDGSGGSQVIISCDGCK